VRHGEGKFFAGDEVLERLCAKGQDALFYALPDGSRAKGKFPQNPNGSIRDIAGLCDPTGRVFGLMPHPEAFNHPTNHPNWTRSREAEKRKNLPPSRELTPGVRLLKNGVDWVKENRG
ncbi:MAG: phosphoribosylformylglycinamidine synthase subunit PurQ, partial [Proteobacteria bacterium]|nr:phosphoribosylformylglycinamidine synthase subunit PurQ [Pseudomonadota bacterium]